MFPVTRNRASAKAAGEKFNRDVADYLAEHIDDRIDKRVRTGAKDKGDIGGMRHPANNARIVGECKNETTGLSLGTWSNETETERINDGAVAGVIFHKRHGKGDPADQWVTCTLRDFVALITGNRPASTRETTDEA